MAFKFNFLLHHGDVVEELVMICGPFRIAGDIQRGASRANLEDVAECRVKYPCIEAAKAAFAKVLEEAAIEMAASDSSYHGGTVVCIEIWGKKRRRAARNPEFNPCIVFRQEVDNGTLGRITHDEEAWESRPGGHWR